MIPFPNIEPVLFELGPITVRWYGVMFLLAFGLVWHLAGLRASTATSTWRPVDVNELVFQGAIGAIVGGRLVWWLLHGFDYENILRVLYIWEGEMSFQGGMLGIIIAMVRFARRRRLNVADVFDFSTPMAAVGMFTVRISNFMKGQLWGRPTDVSWAVVYRGVPRHPLQIYEALLEGLVLGVVLWIFTSRPRPRLAPAGLLLAGYGSIRLALQLSPVAEVSQAELFFGWMTLGELLCLPIIALGVLLLGVAYHRRQPSGNARSWAEPAA